MFWKLLISELKAFNANLALSVGVVALSVACVVSSFFILSLYDASTERLLAAEIAAHRSVLGEGGDDAAVAERLFDALVLPNGENVGEVKMGAETSDVIPRSSADLFAASGAGFARVIIPVLERRISWREENCVVILCGMDGLNASGKGNSKSVVMGAALAETLSFSVGDTFLINGEACKVGAVRPERGDVGDITIWSSLGKVQKLLRMPGKVNGVFVFGCSDSVALAASALRAFPRSKILTFSSMRNSRVASIYVLKEQFDNSIRKFLEERAVSRAALEKKLAIFCVLLITLFAGWFFLLTVSRQTRNANETAMMLAYGVSSNVLFTLDMLRACIVLWLGIVVGLLMVCAAFGCYCFFNGMSMSGYSLVGAFDAKLVIWTLLLTSSVVLAAACSASLRVKYI